MSARGGDDTSLVLTGVSTNNLRGIDVAFPLGKMTVVTGVSGSGKSSLVFDTLYAESYRRYVESLSSFARQYMQALPKPVLTGASNILPAIAVKQGRSTANSRSTVGTATEIHDLLRVIFSAAGEIVCSGCGAIVERDNGESVARKLSEASEAPPRWVLAAPLRGHEIAPKELREHLLGQGFTRVCRVGAAKQGVLMSRLEDTPVKDFKDLYVVVDTVQRGPEGARRLVDSLDLAFRLGRGHVMVVAEPRAGVLGDWQEFSSGLDCPACHQSFQEPSAALLSFNHPMGACPTCQGFGSTNDLDFEKIIPDRSLSLRGGGVAPWQTAFGEGMDESAIASAKRVGIKADKPFSDYTDTEWKWIKEGEGKRFVGIVGYFAEIDQHRHRPHYRIHSARHRSYRTCRVCRGARLVADALVCRIDGRSIADVSRLTLEEFGLWLDSLESLIKAPPRWRPTHAVVGGMGIQEALEEARARVLYLKRIGLGYLSLDRASRTLSGGEWQRINMARCLGSALTETLYCLDEPTAGLHPKDSANLLGLLLEMRDQGNTVVVVEHEREIIRGADHLIEIGPEAGAKGGQVTYAGVPSRAAMDKAIRENFAWSKREFHERDFLTIRGVKTNNLRGVSARIPAGGLTVVCGVSGSGKTSLIQHTLFPMLSELMGEKQFDLSVEPIAAGLGPKEWIKRHTQALLVSQQGIGRSSRSNVATYLGFFDQVRAALAATPTAKAAGLTPGSFSFNSEGGRCETCRGLGRVVEDLSFLGEMEVICPTCRGRRFIEKVLQVEYRGKNVNDILRLTLDEAREFFFDRPAVVKALDTLIGMGLGYITVGQSTSSFSGGEAQRLKLAHLLLDMKALGRSVLIFDEPTTGLSDRDVSRLVAQLQALASAGHTIIVVEHHLGMIRSADWLIELGPGSAHMGGTIVYEGPPSGLKSSPSSPTAAWID